MILYIYYVTVSISVVHVHTAKDHRRCKNICVSVFNVRFNHNSYLLSTACLLGARARTHTHTHTDIPMVIELSTLSDDTAMERSLFSLH
jgi:hypothetical protein